MIILLFLFLFFFTFWIAAQLWMQVELMFMVDILRLTLKDLVEPVLTEKATNAKKMSKRCGMYVSPEELLLKK